MANRQDRTVYHLESHMSTDFHLHLNNEESPWNFDHFGFEFDYGRGRADIIALQKSGVVFAFELKLTRWKKALHQAYRNQSFANYSYVVLPEGPLDRFELIISELSKFNVGLCTIGCDGITILLEATKVHPLQSWLSSKASEYISDLDNGND